jgi:glycosyltransferase involved in cell wall biosynthesis
LDKPLLKINPAVNQPLRILAIVNLPWDPRFGAARVWIELAGEWSKAGHFVERFCLTDAFPTPASSSALTAVRLLLFPFHAAKFVRQNADRFDVIDALVGTLPFSKKSLSFSGLLVARSVGLFYLYEKFERAAAKRWPPASRGKLIGRPFYWLANKRARAASDASIRHCDLVNLPNSDELRCLRDEMRSAKPAAVEPYGITPGRRQALLEAAASADTRWRKKKVAFIGMWSVRKGAKDWGQIIDRIRARVPNACFLFLGTMTETQNVWSDLDRGPVDFVEVVPQFEPDELPQLLSDCTLAAFPSYVEGFGLAVVEQLASGLPTVAYDAPGPRDILGESLPELLVASGDVERFSAAVVEILENGFERYQTLSERSAKAALRFSWPVVAHDTAEEYRKRLDTLASPSGDNLSSNAHV